MTSTSNITQEVFVVVLVWQPDRHREQWDELDKDQFQIIGHFSTLELANDYGEAYVEHRLRVVQEMQKVVAEQFSEGEVKLRKDEIRVLQDKTMKWTVYAPLQFGRWIVWTFRETINTTPVQISEMPYALAEEAKPKKCECDEQCQEHNPESLPSTPSNWDRDSEEDQGEETNSVAQWLERVDRESDDAKGS